MWAHYDNVFNLQYALDVFNLHYVLDVFDFHKDKNLQGWFWGIRDLIFFVSSWRVLRLFISRRTVFHIFAKKCHRAFNP